MFKIEWDRETRGVKLSSKVTKETLGISPRPVWFEELDLLGLDKLGYSYPRTEAPLMWAVNKQYWYCGELMFEAKGANIYDAPTIVFQTGKDKADLIPVDVEGMIQRNADQMFLLESEAIDFIRDTYSAYAGVNRTHDAVKANQIDFEAMAMKVEKQTKQKMAVIKENCESFDIVPLDIAQAEGKRVLLSTKIDRFIASFSGGKDSLVVLDLVTRAIPPTAFEVIYSDTGYELPPSLDLYEEVKLFYGKRFPALKFTTTRNHESVLNYWDKIGTPSDTHRWCCSVMKTAPLYRSLKVEGNKQARVLTFDGVRAEESTRRSGYNRIGKGKHIFTYNAHPILQWNVVEIFLYMFMHNLPNNTAYRLGFSRVGCVICPFGSDWSDYLVSKLYTNTREPFFTRLKSWVGASGSKDADNFIKTRKWHISAIGDPSMVSHDKVVISSLNHNTRLKIHTTQKKFFEWLKVLGEYTFGCSKNFFSGSINVKGNIIPFEGLERQHYLEITFNTEDKRFANNIIKVANKAAYCVNCEVCEVECPTGALQIVPEVKIGDQCVHCLKCLDFHEKGCLTADCLRKISGKLNMDTTLSIKGYKTFGLRDEWVDEYISDPENFWSSTLLGPAMFDSFKSWMKDAEFLNSKNGITSLGEILQDIYLNDPILFWEIIWINLTYNSFIVNRFVQKINPGTSFDKKSLSDEISVSESINSLTTLKNAVGALFDMFKNSPIGSDLEQGEENDKKRKRRAYKDISLEAVVFSIYRYGVAQKKSEFRVSDLYNPDGKSGVALEFGIPKEELIKKLRTISSDPKRILIAELNMGLDHITLRKDLTPETVLKLMTNA